MPFADLILKNARVITMDPARSEAEMVAVKGDRIILVGGNDSLESVTGPRTKVIDCTGKTIAPGFNDAHCHVFSLIRQLLSIDISPASVSSIEDIKSVIYKKTQETPPGQCITAGGYNDFYLAEGRHPTRNDLDEVSPLHPVILLHRSLHACVLNSLALAVAGITTETEEPPGATILRELDGGEPSGVLFEMVGHVSRALPLLSEEEITSGMAAVNQHYLSQGITSLQDATVTNDLGRWLLFRQFKDTGALKSRVSMMFGFDSMSQIREAGLFAGAGDSGLCLGGVKLVLTDAPGEVYPPQPELNQKVLETHQAGFQVAIHAVQQETVEAAVAALEYAHSHILVTDSRLRIEHCSECPSDLLWRLKRLQAVIVTQPPFLYYSGERYLAVVSPERLATLYPIKSLLDSGLVVAGSSDSPIAGDNPLLGIYSAVTRKAETLRPFDEVQDRQAQGERVVVPAERISVARALAMYTINGAYASFEEQIKGSITPGKLADMVVLDTDPTRSSLEGIKDIKVEMTILGGEVVWEG